MPEKSKSEKGRISRQAGATFELKVREDLESKGWIVDKWTNQVEITKTIETTKETFFEGKLVKAKPKFSFNPAMKRMVLVGNGSGFPDFIAFKVFSEKELCFDNNLVTNFSNKIETYNGIRNVIGIESKITGELDREEKEKCRWLLDNKIFSKILIAEKVKEKNKVKIIYHDFQEKYWRFLKSKD